MRKSQIVKQKKHMQNFLPKGEKTKNNYLYTIQHEDQACGMIWLAQKSIEEGFIYDISILEKYQGFGYGKEAHHTLHNLPYKYSG